MKFNPMSLGVQMDAADLHAITSVVSNHFRVNGKNVIGTNVIKYRVGLSDNVGFDEPRATTLVATVRTAYGMEAEVKLIDIVINLFSNDEGRVGTWVASCEGAIFMNTIAPWPHYEEVKLHLLLARVALQVASYLYGEDRAKLSPEVLSRVCLTFDEPVKGTA